MVLVRVVLDDDLRAVGRVSRVKVLVNDLAGFAVTGRCTDHLRELVVVRVATVDVFVYVGIAVPVPAELDDVTVAVLVHMTVSIFDDDLVIMASLDIDQIALLLCQGCFCRTSLTMWSCLSLSRSTLISCHH